MITAWSSNNRSNNKVKTLTANKEGSPRYRTIGFNSHTANGTWASIHQANSQSAKLSIAMIPKAHSHFFDKLLVSGAFCLYYGFAASQPGIATTRNTSAQVVRRKSWGGGGHIVRRRACRYVPILCYIGINSKL